MKHIAIISIFPEMFSALTEYGVVGRAIQQGKVNLQCINPRDFTTDAHQTVDDRPFGGGPGMVMLYQPLADAVASIKQQPQFQSANVILLSPLGTTFNQSLALVSAQDEGSAIFICGRYEGVDERFVEDYVDAQWSMGDFVLSGGEMAVMTMLDAIIRLKSGVLGDADSAELDSFSPALDGLLDYPHYTRPQTIENKPVPDVLLSGHHAKIEQWRKQQSLKRTKEFRPDLLEKHHDALNRDKTK